MIPFSCIQYPVQGAQCPAMAHFLPARLFLQLVIEQNPQSPFQVKFRHAYLVNSTSTKTFSLIVRPAMPVFAISRHFRLSLAALLCAACRCKN